MSLFFTSLESYLATQGSLSDITELLEYLNLSNTCLMSVQPHASDEVDKALF